MLSRIFKATALLLIFYSVSGVAEISVPKLSVMCRKDKEVRTIRIEKAPTGGGCITVYTKYGKDQNIGRAQNPQSCVDILKRVETTLTNADWKCREVQESRVSNLIDL